MGGGEGRRGEVGRGGGRRGEARVPGGGFSSSSFHKVKISE